MPVTRSAIPDLQRPGLAGIEGDRVPTPVGEPRLTDRAKRITEKLKPKKGDAE